MKTVITHEPEGWKVVLTNGNKNLKVIIEGIETRAIAKQQAIDRIKELKKAKLI